MKKILAVVGCLTLIIVGCVLVIGVKYEVPLLSRMPFAGPIRGTDGPGIAQVGEVLSHPFFGKRRPYRSDLETAIRLSKESGEIILTDRGQIWTSARECEPCKLVRVKVEKGLTREQIIYLIVQELDKN